MSILCSWKIFNGDYVDNYDDTSLKPHKPHEESNPKKDFDEET